MGSFKLQKFFMVRGKRLAAGRFGRRPGLHVHSGSGSNPEHSRGTDSRAYWKTSPTQQLKYKDIDEKLQEKV